MKELPPPVLRELVRLLIKNIHTSALPYSILAIILYALLLSERRSSGLNAWLLLVLTTQAISFSYTRWCGRKDIAQRSPKKVITAVALLSALQSIAWGSIVWFTVEDASHTSNILSITIVAAFLGVVMLSLAPIWPLSVLFGTLATLVPAFKFFVTGNNYSVLTLAGVPYIAALSYQARNSYLSIKSSIELQFQNLSLIEQLRVESDNAIAANQRTQAANHAKSQFLASASHDLRQPLHALSLFLESLHRTQTAPKQSMLIEKSLSAAQDMGDMLHAILDISRIEAGAITPNRVAFPLQPLLHKLEAALGPVADAKRIAYRSRETICTVYTDPFLLEQILRNIIANALNYTQQGGVLIGCRRRGTVLQIEVWDTGIGVAEEQMDTIFQEFHQVHNAERDRKKGFGLGLSIVKGLSQTLGHTYSFHSILGKGSCFKISVPLSHTVLAETSEQIPIAQSEQMTLNVLVIDDDAAIRESIDALLSSWGCHCQTSDTAAAAITLAQKCHPDLIISDYRLRDQQTGTQTIQQLREALGAPIPALIITGDTSPLRLHELMATNIPVLHKPVSARQLYLAMVEATGPAVPAP